MNSSVLNSLAHPAAQPTFSGLSSAGTFTKTIARLEKLEMNGGKAYAVQKAVEDTATSLGSRMLVVSGLAEATEVLFNELLETGVVYGVIGPVAQRFHRLYKRLALQGVQGNSVSNVSKLADESLSNVSGKALQHVAPARLATFLSAIAVSCLFGQSAIIYAKNILTALSFKKESFSGLLHLKHETITNPKDSPTVQKSLKRIGQLALATLGIVGSSAALARYGHQLSGRFQQRVQKLAKIFDFDMAQKAGKLSMGMTRNHLMGFMAIAFAAYLDAARDGLERQETAPRLLIIFANLLLFKGAFDKHVVLPLAKKFAPELVKGDQVLKYPQLNQANVFKKLTPQRQNVLRSVKNGLFLAPYVFGTVIVSATNSILNRYFTKKRFQQQYVQPVAKHMAQLDRAPLYSSRHATLMTRA